MIAVVAAISVEEVNAAVLAQLNGGAGAVVSFVGVVRNLSHGREIDYLEYQAYVPMAHGEMTKIAQELRRRWDMPCAIVHRIGRLEIGEASIVVAVAAPHRRDAFEACHWAIDRVKQTVPVWKKEVAADGYWWVEDPLGVQGG